MNRKKSISSFAFILSAIGITCFAFKPVNAVSGNNHHLNTSSLATNIGIESPAESYSKNSATEILNQVYANYKKRNMLRVDFNTSYSQGTGSVNTVQEKGVLWLVQNKNLYRINLKQQDFISDGTSQWVVLKDAKEVQISDAPSESSQISPANMFSFFQKGFSKKLLESQSIGNRNLWIIELTPEKRNQAYEKILLRIDKKDYQINDIQIFDKNKGKLAYEVKTVQTLQKIDPSTFKFNLKEYPGFDVVDLR